MAPIWLVLCGSIPRLHRSFWTRIWTPKPLQHCVELSFVRFGRENPIAQLTLLLHDRQIAGPLLRCHQPQVRKGFFKKAGEAFARKKAVIVEKTKDATKSKEEKEKAKNVDSFDEDVKDEHQNEQVYDSRFP